MSDVVQVIFSEKHAVDPESYGLYDVGSRSELLNRRNDVPGWKHKKSSLTAFLRPKRATSASSFGSRTTL